MKSKFQKYMLFFFFNMSFINIYNNYQDHIKELRIKKEYLHKYISDIYGLIVLEEKISQKIWLYVCINDDKIFTLEVNMDNTTIVSIKSRNRSNLKKKKINTQKIMYTDGPKEINLEYFKKKYGVNIHIDSLYESFDESNLVNIIFNEHINDLFERLIESQKK